MFRARRGRRFRGSTFFPFFSDTISTFQNPIRSRTNTKNSIPLYTEHGRTYAHLRHLPPPNIQWSLLCPSVIAPSSSPTSSNINHNNFIATPDHPPAWTPFPIPLVPSIPFVGPILTVLLNAGRYTTKLADCADLIAADLEKHLGGSEFVGRRVGVCEREGKAE